MLLNDATKSYYFEEDLNYSGDITCLHFYACKNVFSGNQVVSGNQDVRYIYLYLYCRYAIRIDRDTDDVKIGYHQHTAAEWTRRFAAKEYYENEPDSRNYKKVEVAFRVALLMREQLILMNDKPKTV